MSIYAAFLWTALGVLVSFALPPLLRVAGVSSAGDPTASVSALWPRIRSLFTNRYFVTTLVSLILALLVVAVLDDQIDTWNMALLSGLGWQSILARTLTPGTYA